MVMPVLSASRTNIVLFEMTIVAIWDFWRVPSHLRLCSVDHGLGCGRYCEFEQNAVAGLVQWFR
jgi:hypothetical protein